MIGNGNADLEWRLLRFVMKFNESRALFTRQFDSPLEARVRHNNYSWSSAQFNADFVLTYTKPVKYNGAAKLERETKNTDVKI